MSSANQTNHINSQPQQPARERIGTGAGAVAQRACPPGDHRYTKNEMGLLVTTHHLEGLVTGYLEQFPGFLGCALQKHEIWLARYLLAEYNIQLPTRKVNFKHPASSQARHDAPPNPRPTSARVTNDASVNSRPAPSSATKPAANPPARKPYNAPLASSRFVQPPVPSSAFQTSTHYQKLTVENGSSYDSAEDDNSHSPKSTPSQPSAWPTEEDLSVPYPAPDKWLAKERGKPTGTGRKWTFDEQDIAIGYMYKMRDDPQMPKTERRFEEVSRLMMEEHKIERSKNSVKNMWNRIGRARSKYDERKNKNAPLATSQQGKHARIENELKKAGKRKAVEEPPSAEPQQKMRKTAALTQLPLFDLTAPPAQPPLSDPALASINYQLHPGYDTSAPVYVNMNEIQPQGTLPTVPSLPLPELGLSDFNGEFDIDDNYFSAFDYSNYDFIPPVFDVRAGRL
jgi:hypothetical protein